MGKKSRGKKNKKMIRMPVDEVLQYGPLRIERCGRFVRFSNNSSPEQHAEILRLSAEENKKVLLEFPGEVARLQSLITKHDPVELMHRATYMVLPLFMKYSFENEYGSEETRYLPALEYIQYLIARTSQNTDKKGVTEEEWNEIWGQVMKIMTLTQTFLFTRKTSANPPSEIDELRFFLDGMRLGIRVHQYPFFLKQYWKNSLTPYERWIKEVYGTDVDNIIKGLSEIDAYQKTGVIDRYRQSVAAIEVLRERLLKKGFSISPDASVEELEETRAALSTEEFQLLNEDAQEKARLTFTSAVFDVTDVTSLPKSILSLLSVKPGESISAPHENQKDDDLSPLSTSILHYKPFLEADGRFYTFYHSGFEDRIAEIIESDMYARFPTKVSELAKQRSDAAELISKNLLASLVKPDFVYQNIYYPNPDEIGDLTELDILLGVDDVLFIVEVKAGGFSEGASRGAPKSMEREFSDLIIKGQHQSERAEKYIKSAPQVEFFDESGKRALFTIKQADFRRIFRIIVTRERLGWVGARIVALSVLDPGLSRAFPWHVSVDDLQVIGELFKDSEIRFVHFLEQRLQASSEVALSQHDEIDHVALYNSLNQYHELSFKDVDRTTFDASYMRSIDTYFIEKSKGENPQVPTQILSEKVSLLLEAIRNSKLSGRFEAASMILGMGEDSRNGLERALEHLILGLSEKKLRTARIPFTEEYGFTVTYAEGQYLHEELVRSAALMKQGRCQRWLVIGLEMGYQFKIGRITRIFPSMFSESELASGRLHLEETTQKIVEKEGVGRNDPCPCASGKKYKKCHGY